MDSRARVEAALALERADRPPYGWWGHTFAEEWSVDALADTTVAKARRYGWDFVKVQPRACCFAEAFGSKYAPSPDPTEPPEMLSQSVRMLEDWAWLPKVDAATQPLSDQVEVIRRVVSELGPSVPVIQTVFSPITIAGYLIGRQEGRIVREVRKYPRALEEGLARIAAGMSSFSAACIEAGAAGIFFAISGYTDAEVMGHGEYEQHVLAQDRRVLESLPSEAWFNVLHCCGSRINLAMVKDLPVQALSWSVGEAGNPGLAEARDQLNVAVMGGLSHKEAMLHGGPGDVEKEVRAAIDDTGGRGLLIAPGCSVPPAVSEENLKAVVAAAVEGT